MRRSTDITASPGLWPPSPVGEGLGVRPHKLFDLDNMHLRENAKSLRSNMTCHEKILWRELRAGRLADYKFRRQFPIGYYILDFFCYSELLAIELDGSQHADNEIKEYDRIRTLHLESYNIRVLRFWNSEVTNDMKNVLETIYYHLASKA